MVLQTSTQKFNETYATNDLLWLTWKLADNEDLSFVHNKIYLGLKHSTVNCIVQLPSVFVDNQVHDRDLIQFRISSISQRYPRTHPYQPDFIFIPILRKFKHSG